MTTATTTVACPCGTSFKREVKRGRPQKWCETCLAIPYVSRVAAPVAPVTPDVATVETAAETPHNHWDQHNTVRAQIEANVAEVYAGWPTTAALMRASGATNWDVSHAQAEALRGAYHRAGVR